MPPWLGAGAPGATSPYAEAVTLLMRLLDVWWDHVSSAQVVVCSPAFSGYDKEAAGTPCRAPAASEEFACPRPRGSPYWGRSACSNASCQAM